jgi:hypothetical protein
MGQHDPMDEARAFYENVVNEAIQDKASSTAGRIQQVGNIDVIRGLIRQAPKGAQLAIQMLHQIARTAPPEASENAMLHGVWIMVAYLLEYGKFDPTSLMLKRFAPELYNLALTKISAHQS